MSAGFVLCTNAFTYEACQLLCSAGVFGPFDLCVCVFLRSFFGFLMTERFV